MSINKKRWLMVVVIVAVVTVLVPGCSKDKLDDKVPVSGISLGEQININVGESRLLECSFTPANPTIDTVEWSSDKPEIVIVSTTGEITGLAPGSATITVVALDGGHTATCTVIVSAIDITLNHAEYLLYRGKDVQLLVMPAGADNTDYVWASSDDKVAQVTLDGVVTGLASGSAVITVATADGERSAACTVIVKDPQWGNSIGNIANGGLATFIDDWVYYSTSSEIWRMQNNGEGQERLLEHPGKYLNVTENILWFVHSDSLMAYNLDTRQTRTVMGPTYDPYRLYGDEIHSGTVIYNAQDVADKWQIEIPDGYGAEELFILDSWVYYTDEDPSNTRLSRVSINGDHAKSILDMHVHTIVTDKTWVYCINREDSKLWRVKHDGSSPGQLGNQRMEIFNIDDSRIFYANQDDNNYLYSMTLSGKGVTRLAAHSVDQINIAGDWIFLHSGDQYYRLKQDGTNPELLQ